MTACPACRLDQKLADFRRQLLAFFLAQPFYILRRLETVKRLERAETPEQRIMPEKRQLPRKRRQREIKNCVGREDLSILRGKYRIKKRFL